MSAEKRYRCFMLVIYEDDENYFDYINCIVNKEFINKEYHYLGITHDKDIADDGQLKKSHDHIVLYFENARTISSLSKELGLPPQYIEKYTSLKTALLYLIHFNEGDKIQYKIDDTYGDLKDELQKYIRNTPKNEEQRVLMLLEIIDNYFKFTSYSQFLKDICNRGLYDIFRRNSFMFVKILDKHNENFYNNN